MAVDGHPAQVADAAAAPRAAGRSERIDAVRGLAALAVVACHLGVSAYRDAPNAGGGPAPWLGLVLGFGYLGVPLFFVISGFCIHLPQARALALRPPAPAAWRVFFVRRFWRLYPPYAAALVVAVILALSSRGEVSWAAVAAQAFLVQTLHPATFDGVNPPAWSLAVEAQLYLVYPLVFWMIVRRGAVRALAIVLGVTMLYRVALTVDLAPAPFGNVAWELFLGRWFEWVLGAVIAEWTVAKTGGHRAATWAAAAALALAAGVALEWQRWRYGAYAIMVPLYGVAFALLLRAVLEREQRGGGLSRPGRWLASVGAYSYSLYLLHRPIQLAFEPLAREVARWPVVLDHALPTSLAIMAAASALALPASRIFYRFCEAPFIARSHRVRPLPAHPRAPPADAPGARELLR